MRPLRLEHSIQSNSHFLVNIQCCRGLSHRFCHLGSRAPNRIAHVFLVPHIILLLLLDVVVFSGAAPVPPKSLIEPGVGQVSPLPGTIRRHEALLLWLLFKGLGGSESQNVGVESAVLAHHVPERLLLVVDQ